MQTPRPAARALARASAGARALARACAIQVRFSTRRRCLVEEGAHVWPRELCHPAVRLFPALLSTLQLRLPSAALAAVGMRTSLQGLLPLRPLRSRRRLPLLKPAVILSCTFDVRKQDLPRPSVSSTRGIGGGSPAVFG